MDNPRNGWRQRFRWTNRDTIWLILLFVLLLAFKFKDIGELNSMISFAGTTVSIILGVVAIFYAMVQASDTSQLMGEMRSKLEQVSADTQAVRRATELKPVEPLTNAEQPDNQGEDAEDTLELMCDVLRQAFGSYRENQLALIGRQQLIETAVRSGVSFKNALNGFDALLDAKIVKPDTIAAITFPGGRDLYEVDISKLMKGK